MKNGKVRWGKIALVTVSTASLCVLLILLIRQMIRMSILPILYSAILCALIAVLFFVGLLMVFSKKIYLKVLGVIFIIASFVSTSLGLYFYSNTIKALDVIADQKTEVTTYGIYVLKDSSIQTVEELKSKNVGLATGQGEDEVTAQLTAYAPNICTYDNQIEVVNSLFDYDSDAIVLNTAYVSILDEGDESEDGEAVEEGTLDEPFSDRVRLIDTIDISKVVEAAEPITPEEPFIVYISGKDTWGHISVTSRSDVNILAVVNPETKHILLVSTPRDYYVPLSISNGVKDKLTHAGIYGVDVSEDTLEMLYDVEIDHYFKVNFSGFEGLIDAMGGITVWSDYAFDVERIGHFNEGENHLTGLQALAFVRERHSFAAGDRQRGENQMNVIQSVIQKMTTKETLMNYAEIMRECDGTFATDMTAEEISDLVAFQLSNPGDWEIEKLSVSGTGERNYVYSLSKQVYVMNPNEEDVENAKERIQAVLNE